jgi:hypothetical protein
MLLRVAVMDLRCDRFETVGSTASHGSHAASAARHQERWLRYASGPWRRRRWTS